MNEETRAVIEDSYRITVITDNAEEMFDLHKIPDLEADYVQGVKRKLMSSLELAVVVDNLYNTADLLCVAYNAFEETTAKRAVAGLQVDLETLCGDSQAAMSEINTNTDNMLRILPTVYTLLAKGKAAGALTILSAGSKCANGMAIAVERLAAKVEAMIDKSTEVLLKSEALYAEDIRLKEEMVQKIKQMQINREVPEQKTTDMQGMIDQIQEQCMAAKIKKQAADKQTFTMETISMLAGISNEGIGDIVSLLRWQIETNEQDKAAAKKAVDAVFELQRKQSEMQNDRIELEGDLKKLAEQVKNQRSESVSLDTAVEMLRLALQCLGNIVSALQATAISWRGIESGFKSFSEDTLLVIVDSLPNQDVEQQTETYLKESFMGQMLFYMSAWAALNSISSEYGTASAEAGHTVHFNVSHPKYEKDAHDTARHLADDILSRIK